MTAPAGLVVDEPHPCVPCPRCLAACGCYAPGLCDRCDREQFAERERADALADRARYEAELRDPERLYAIPSHHSGRLHDLGCAVVTGIVVGAQACLDDVDPLHDGWISPTWPHLLTRTEALALRRERCRLCAPDLPAKRPPKVRTKRTGLGWPLADGRCAR